MDMPGGRCYMMEEINSFENVIVGMYAHARCAALVGCESDGQRRRVLSDRERDILAWAAEGKSSWEIATILGVSERTVNWHVEQSKKKLDAVTRTQAVIKALRSAKFKPSTGNSDSRIISQKCFCCTVNTVRGEA